MPHFPSSEMVAVAWAKLVPGVDPLKIATSLPGDPTAWTSTGFVQATVAGGAPDPHARVFESVVSFDCWANSPNSSRAPWGQAGALAAAVQWGTYTPAPFTIEMPDGYHAARLLSVYALGMPQRRPVEVSGYARVGVDVMLIWTVTA